MVDRDRKPMLTPIEPASDAGVGGHREQGPPKPLVGGSIPSGPASCTNLQY